MIDYQPVPMDYQRLGDHIREVNIRNRELRVTNLQGVSISKAFMPSIANIIGTDMSTYKIVERGQFAYGPVTSRNGDKVSIALLDDCDNAIISQAYTVFEVINTDKLLPEYLMMWFRRPEFDRYARFHSHGSAREVFDWEEMCDVQLPVPPIERQREIVAEYETLTRRIRLNQQIIQRLEDTAQALYRNTFVDNIDKQNLPPAWHLAPLGEICESTLGGDWGKDVKTGNYISEVYCIRGADITHISRGMKFSMPTRFVLEKNLNSRQLKAGDVAIEISGGSPTQSTGRSVMITEDLLDYVKKDLICSNFCRLIKVQKEFRAFFYASLQHLYANDVLFKFENSSNGVKNLDLSALLYDETMTIPSKETAISFADNYMPLLKHIYITGREIETINELQSLLLAKMGQ